MVLFAVGRGDVVVAVLLGALILATGRAVFRGYSTTKGPTGPPVDVAEEGTLLVFACETCGEQLVLLRKGTDVPPRHCAEKMVLRRVPTPSSRPATPGSTEDRLPRSRPPWSVAVGDAFGAVAEGAVVLVAAVFGEELVGAGEAPALVLHGDPGPAAAELAAAGLAGAGGVAAEGLEVLLGLAAGSAGILVDGQVPVAPVGCPQPYPQLGKK